jgi:AcrR family transcriptional regulator
MTTARARAREALTEEIKEAARRQIAAEGAAALSLRAVARELGMVSSALYRYFASRDELLTALIVDAYDAIGAVAEASTSTSTTGGFVRRWQALANAIRSWALANPHDFALAYGSPVPGYRAPADTIAPAQRVAFAALALVVDAIDDGEVDTTKGNLPRPMRADLARIRDLAAPGVPDEVLARALAAWTQLFGHLSFELFGQLENVITDRNAFFEHQVRTTADFVLRGTA